MPVPLYLDVHVPLAIAEPLRRRGVDVVHAILAVYRQIVTSSTNQDSGVPEA